MYHSLFLSNTLTQVHQWYPRDHQMSQKGYPLDLSCSIKKKKKQHHGEQIKKIWYVYPIE